jgi:hypothetical protein
MRALLLLPLSLAAALAACNKAPPPPTRIEGPLPAQICTQVGKSLDALVKGGGVVLGDKGEATVEQAAWLDMTGDERNSFATALAFRAGCASGQQSQDQEVTIHGEDGSVLMHRFISTRTDPQSALEGGG